MGIEFDEKGKYFTEVVSKNVVLCHIQLQTGYIRGCVHVRVGERLSDEINTSSIFLAVTNAEIHSLEGAILFTNNFLVVNRAHIVWVMPVEDDRAKVE